MTNTNFLERNKSQMDSSSTFDKRGVVDARKGTDKQAKRLGGLIAKQENFTSQKRQNPK